jgi:hypothetical protein
LPFFEIDCSMTDAIQAPQGPFGPFRSQGSRHAVDAQVRLLDLSDGCTDPHSPDQACQDKEASDSSNLHHLSFKVDF